MWVYIAAAAFAIAVGFTGGWKVASWRADSKAAEVREQTARETAKQIERATSAATSFEQTRAAQRIKTITVTREVQREVAADADCSAKPLPDGLRNALVRAASPASEPGAASPLPAARTASAANVGGLGAGLR